MMCRIAGGGWIAGGAAEELMMRDGGWKLRAARAERGLTEDALAMEVRRWADLHGTSRPEITAATIAEWEAGSRPIDGAALRLLWLALVAPNRRWADPDVAVWSLFRPAGRPDHAARRQEFLDYAATLGEPVTVDPDRLDAMLDEAIRVDSRTVEGLAFVARQLRKRLGTEPPHATRRLAHAHLEAILGLLDHTIAGDLRHNLEAAAAMTAVFAGIVSIYVCRLEPAAVYLELGQRLAREAGDVETEAIGLLAASRLHSHISPLGPTGNPARARELLNQRTSAWAAGRRRPPTPGCCCGRPRSWPATTSGRRCGSWTRRTGSPSAPARSRSTGSAAGGASTCTSPTGATSTSWPAARPAASRCWRRR